MSDRPKRERLDVAIVRRGLCESRARGQALIMAGKVSVGGMRADKAGTMVQSDSVIEVQHPGQQYVSRGGEKMAGALADFAPHGLTVSGKVIADFGASTGGFVDCVLQLGALRVHAIDVGWGLLHAKLRDDPRVKILERTNARYVTAAALGEQVQVVLIDASFIGLGKLLGAALDVLAGGGELVALIKPQFEAGRTLANQTKGVIRDPEVRAELVRQALEEVQSAGFELVADAPCRLQGPKGNQEHFVYALKPRGANSSAK